MLTYGVRARSVPSAKCRDFSGVFEERRLADQRFGKSVDTLRLVR